MKENICFFEHHDVQCVPFVVTAILFSVTFSNLSRPIAAWVEIIMSEKLGLVGRKIGMTRIFTEDGVSIPVTVLEVSNNRITQVKNG